MDYSGLSIREVLDYVRSGVCTDPKFMIMAYDIIWGRVSQGDTFIPSEHKETLAYLFQYVQSLRMNQPTPVSRAIVQPGGSANLDTASAGPFKPQNIDPQPGTSRQGPTNSPLVISKRADIQSVDSFTRPTPMNQPIVPLKGAPNFDTADAAQPSAAQNTSDEPRCTMRYITIHREYQKLIKKFNMTSNSVTFNFKPVDEVSNPLQWLEAAFQELLEYTTQNAAPSDRVGIVLRNHNYPEKPLGISFRRADQLSTAVILDVIEKVLQSNARFFAQDAMTINIDRVTLPIGYGRTRLTGTSFEDFCRLKKGIIEVPTLENMCLASAIVIAIAFRDRDQKLGELQTGSPLLFERSLHLCRVSQVDLTDGGNYDHIQKFQDYLTNYTIVVYNSRNGNTTYFEGPRDRNRVVLNLILEANHYNVITSLPSAFTASYFCELCKYKFNDKKDHLRCKYSCPCCHLTPPCNIMLDTILCTDCNRDFRGAECLAAHRASQLCNKLYRCSICLCSVWKSSRTHKCGQKFCQTCKKIQPIRHFCYMSKNIKKANSNKAMDKVLFVFYDLECRQETEVLDKQGHFIHEPNLWRGVAAHVCLTCLNDEDLEQACQNCGKRLHVFKDDPVNSFLEYLSKLGRKFKVTALAHNMKGYDGCFVLRSIIKNRTSWEPKLITTGTKIISMTCGKIKFIDSLNFLPLPLCKLPRTFEFAEAKGYFPYLFNTVINQHYVGSLPPVNYYAPDNMDASDRSKLLEWHDNKLQNGYIFDMQKELVSYCILDVQILAKACLRFWKLFTTENDVDPFQESVTIASACNLVFRRRFLRDNTIGIIPPGGYRMADKQSAVAIGWLSWLEYSNGLDIQHCGKSREFRLPNGVLVDGFCRENNTVYEFLGCYWHGCEVCFPTQTSDVNNDANAMFLRRENTEARSARIRNSGYTLTVIWECQFTNFLKRNQDAKTFIENLALLKHEPLDPRDGFFGGRTNAVKLYHKCQPDEKIHYWDVCSLYPSVNKYGKYPVGHPEVHIGHEACSQLPIDSVEGLVKCLVLPPSSLFHPVLPYRANNKLMFILCRTCAETLHQGLCTHNDQERSFVGTYVADELRMALEKNYAIVEIFEIWEYKTVKYDKDLKTGGLFSGYVDNFIKMKQECSGWPNNCITDSAKESYILKYLEIEGVQLNKDKIRNNPGLRYLSKLMLNSFWGKFGQRENLMQSSIINNPEDFFKLLTSPDVEVHSVVAIDDDVVVVSWDKHAEAVKPLQTVNVAIASYTTSQARLELYKYLDRLGDRVLYFDTDSVIFTSKAGEWLPETGEFLGQLTDEVAQYGLGSYITEFVSGGPKNYSYKVYSTAKNTEISICKVKGITLNFKNSSIINFDSMKELICDNVTGGLANEPLYVCNDRKIVRTSNFEVISRPERKVYQYGYNKRQRLPDSFATVPYGFKM